VKPRLPLLLMLPLAVTALACVAGTCDNTVVRRLASPDGTLEAVLFQRSCGATTGFSTQVSVIVRGQELPRREGNLFIADRDHGKAPAARWGGPPTELLWQEGNRLVVRYAVEARVLRQDATLEIAGQTVHVAYERVL
jgi:hypothetical protein